MIKVFREQKDLIEEIGLSIEETLKLSPLAARIYALLTLSSYEGLTFDEIREVVEASKSSTSVNINVLIQLKYLKYHTKPGDRKRYFKVARYFQLQSLELLHQSLENEIKMVDKINAFNKAYHPEKFKNEKSIGSITQGYFREQQKLIKNTLQKMASFQKNDTSY
ncbi:MAG: hypothetical protein ABI290_10570 [Ginsengibacter sp.]